MIDYDLCVLFWSFFLGKEIKPCQAFELHRGWKKISIVGMKSYANAVEKFSCYREMIESSLRPISEFEKIICEGKEVYYDSKLWEVIEIPEEYRMNGLECMTRTLHYVGPIVKGEIQEYVPPLIYYYHTFEGLEDLVTIPEVSGFAAYCAPFKGCKNLVIAQGEAEEKGYSYASRHIGDLFSNARSSNIQDLSGDNKEIVSRIFDVSIDDVESSGTASNSIFTKDEYGHVEEIDVQAIRTIANELNPELHECTTMLSTGHTFSVVTYHKASELPEKASILSYNNDSKRIYVVLCEWTGAINLGDWDIILGVLADDFIIDTPNVKLMAIVGPVLNGVNLTETLDLGNKQAILVSGYNTIRVNNGPGIACGGDLLIKGSGTLIVKGGGIHPAIGTRTHDEMSYGRWCPSDGKFNKIIIDGVSVICEVGDVKDFTIGRYGTNDMPEIVLRNDAELIAPETQGHRIMLKSGAEDLYGSTKRERCAEYEIEHDQEEMHFW